LGLRQRGLYSTGNVSLAAKEQNKGIEYTGISCFLHLNLGMSGTARIVIDFTEYECDAASKRIAGDNGAFRAVKVMLVCHSNLAGTLICVISTLVSGRREIEHTGSHG
jgi:hypothetical protein